MTTKTFFNDSTNDPTHTQHSVPNTAKEHARLFIESKIQPTLSYCRKPSCYSQQPIHTTAHFRTYKRGSHSIKKVVPVVPIQFKKRKQIQKDTRQWQLSHTPPPKKKDQQCASEFLWELLIERKLRTCVA